MKNYKSFLAYLLLSLIALSNVVGCAKKQDDNTIKVGVIAGPEMQLMEVAKTVAQNRYGLKIDIVPFTDYQMPNAALSDGSIDANMFQHQPYLEQSLAQHHYAISAIGKTFIYPMGAYSKKIKLIAQLPEKAKVAIPNDPSNGSRALLLLQQNGLIQLKDNHLAAISLMDIKSNPKNLQFIEIDAAQLPRALADVDLAIINTNYAISAGLNPLHDALFHENSDSPYGNIVVVRTADKDNEKLQHLIAALHSDEVMKKAHELFGDSAIAAWK
jgi:D-methionine transport system substrate-binding protein